MGTAPIWMSCILMLHTVLIEVIAPTHQFKWLWYAFLPRSPPPSYLGSIERLCLFQVLILMSLRQMDNGIVCSKESKVIAMGLINFNVQEVVWGRGDQMEYIVTSQMRPLGRTFPYHDFLGMRRMMEALCGWPILQDLHRGDGSCISWLQMKVSCQF